MREFKIFKILQGSDNDGPLNLNRTKREMKIGDRKG